MSTTKREFLLKFVTIHSLIIPLPSFIRIFSFPTTFIPRGCSSPQHSIPLHLALLSVGPSFFTEGGKVLSTSPFIFTHFCFSLRPRHIPTSFSRTNHSSCALISILTGRPKDLVPSVTSQLYFLYL